MGVVVGRNPCERNVARFLEIRDAFDVESLGRIKVASCPMRDTKERRCRASPVPLVLGQETQRRSARFRVDATSPAAIVR